MRPKNENYTGTRREISEHGVTSEPAEGVGSLPCTITTVFGVLYVLCVSMIT